MKLSALRTDVKAVEKALEASRWVDEIPGMDNLRLEVRALGNSAYKAAYARKESAIPNTRKIRGLKPEDRDRIVGECLAETVLLNWEGIEGEDGKPLAYEPELARKMLTDPDYGAFTGAVVYASGLLAAEAEEQGKRDEGNSASASAGT